MKSLRPKVAHIRFRVIDACVLSVSPAAIVHTGSPRTITRKLHAGLRRNQVQEEKYQLHRHGMLQPTHAVGEYHPQALHFPEKSEEAESGRISEGDFDSASVKVDVQLLRTIALI